MSTTTFKPKRGTTAEWTQAKRVLEERELGLEVTTDGKYILRIGDGKTEFMKLPAAISTPYFDELTKAVDEKYKEIKKFESEMTQATQNANTATTAATEAKRRADEAAQACEGIAEGLNTMIDDQTKAAYRMGIENGKMYLKEVTE